jgi:hypothetical protein
MELAPVLQTHSYQFQMPTVLVYRKYFLELEMANQRHSWREHQTHWLYSVQSHHYQTPVLEPRQRVRVLA